MASLTCNSRGWIVARNALLSLNSFTNSKDDLLEYLAVENFKIMYTEEAEPIFWVGIRPSAQPAASNRRANTSADRLLTLRFLIVFCSDCTTCMSDILEMTFNLFGSLMLEDGSCMPTRGILSYMTCSLLNSRECRALPSRPSVAESIATGSSRLSRLRSF